MRLLIATALLVIGSRLAAQTPENRTAERPPAAAVGSTVRIRTADGRILRGKLEQLDADGLRLRHHRRSDQFSTAQVASIEMNQRRHNVGGTIGFAVGAVIGAGLVAQAVAADFDGPCPCIPLRTMFALPFGAAIMGSGAILGTIVFTPPVWRPVPMPMPARF